MTFLCLMLVTRARVPWFQIWTDYVFMNICEFSILSCKSIVIYYVLWSVNPEVIIIGILTGDDRSLRSSCIQVPKTPVVPAYDRHGTWWVPSVAPTLQKNTLPWWYAFVTVGRFFCHACTSMTNLWQNQDSHTCAVVEVFDDITKIIITEVSTSMTINRASQKCFRQRWPTRGIHHNGTPLSYRVGFWIR